MNTNANSPPIERGNSLDVMLRLGWMAVGPAVAAVLLTVLLSSGGWFTGTNLAFGLCVAATVVVRWWEWLRGAARTADGEPATREHLVRYTLALLVCSAAAWIVVNAIAGYGWFA